MKGNNFSIVLETRDGKFITPYTVKSIKGMLFDKVWTFGKPKTKRELELYVAIEHFNCVDGVSPRQTRQV